MSKAATADAPRARYNVTEFLLILVAVALVALTVWYVRHATVNANTAYSITETSQKASTPNKAVIERNAAQ